MIPETLYLPLLVAFILPYYLPFSICIFSKYGALITLINIPGFWHNTDIETLRKKYMENPPEGMTSQDIRSMSEDALLDMDYFLNDDELDDDFGEEGFYLF